MINFNEPLVTGKEIKYINQVLETRQLSGDGEFTRKCHRWLEKKFHCRKALLATSGTSALDMAAILAGIEPGDEVIMPSFTFVSTANAFVLRGAKVIFIDIRPDTMNINEELIESAITRKTKAIVVVHYAGVSCEMDIVVKIAKKHKLYIIEDAAQGVMSKYKGKYLGTIGDIGCYSFHETKNYTCGEGGAIILNDKKMAKRAEIVWEKGTNRSDFHRGMIDKYTWVDIGSSYLPSELNAAFLYAQFNEAEKIKKIRLKRWNQYYSGLKLLADRNLIKLPCVPVGCKHNGHMFYIKVKDYKEREKLIAYLKAKNIMAVFHYIPLHTSLAGKKFSKFNGKDLFTTNESEKILRLPLYFELDEKLVRKIIDSIILFYRDLNGGDEN